MRQKTDHAAYTADRRLFARVISMAIAASAFVACSGRNASPAVSVSVASSAVTEGRISRSIPVSGVIAPAETVTIYPKISGTMKEVTVDVGSKVGSGQILARIDAQELAAQLEVAQAAVAMAKDRAAQADVGMQTARLSLDQAQRDYDRNAALFDSKVVTQSQLDDCKAKLDLAKAGYESAERQLAAANGSGLREAEAQANLIQVQLQNAEIQSPIAGTVASRNINVGELCSPSSPLMTIADTTELKFRGVLPQEEILALKGGEKAVVTISGLDAPYEGRVTRLGPVAAASGQYFPIELSLESDGRLLAGMTAKATIAVADQEGIVVPLSSILRRDPDDFVFVIENGRAHLKKVRLGSRDGSTVIALSGLTEGDVVATSGVATLQDDSEVSR